MSRRSRAREVVLQVLFEDDLNPSHSLTASDRFLRQRLNQDVELVEFATTLLAGVRRHRPQLDQLLAERAENWSLRRMAVTDRNVLRLGAYEILFTGIPARAAINEAVGLARRFGTRQSGHFVNGILDRFLREAEQRSAVEPETP
ncbi:MAG: transcription antitermination factor NusB [Pirellulaceae bacterium]